MDINVDSSYYLVKSDVLVKAILAGRESRVRRLVQEGVDINIKDKYGRVPLIIAWDARRINIVNYLIDEMVNRDGLPVMVACENNNKDLVKYLWEYGFDLNQGDDDGVTPLIVACERGYADLVEYLVRHGADVNKGDNNGVTPLLIACERDYGDLARYLIECGAEVNIRDRKGRFPVLLAWENKKLLGYFVDEMMMFEEKTFGDILLILACRANDKNLVRWLIEEEGVTTCNKRYIQQESDTNQTKKIKITNIDEEKIGEKNRKEDMGISP